MDILSQRGNPELQEGFSGATAEHLWKGVQGTSLQFALGVEKEGLGAAIRHRGMSCQNSSLE